MLIVWLWWGGFCELFGFSSVVWLVLWCSVHSALLIYARVYGQAPGADSVLIEEFGV